MTDHPSQLMLERYSVDDLPPEAHASAAEHVGSCSSCKAFIDELANEHRARLVAAPVAAFVAKVDKRRRRRSRVWQAWQWSGFGLGIATVAAAVVMLSLAGRPTDHIRWKGSALVVHRSRAGNVQVLGERDTIRAGDSLRLVLVMPKAAPVAAWFVDAHGRVDRFLPELVTRLDAGEHALPGSAVVETPCADLWIVVVAGADANTKTEADLGTALVNGVPGNDQWIPAGAVVRTVRCE